MINPPQLCVSDVRTWEIVKCEKVQNVKIGIQFNRRIY
jgi:hypothetical protein